MQPAGLLWPGLGGTSCVVSAEPPAGGPGLAPPLPCLGLYSGPRDPEALQSRETCGRPTRTGGLWDPWGSWRESLWAQTCELVC